MSTPPLVRSVVPNRAAIADRVPTVALLVLGTALTFATSYRWAVPAVGWLAPVPWLLVARRLRSWRGWLALLGVVMLAVHLQVAKIVTAPIPPALVFAFAPPFALGALLTVRATEALRRRGGELAGIVGFAALTAVVEIATYAASPMGMWGTAASGQVDDLALLQLASVTGVAGIGAVMALVQATVATVLAAATPRRHLRVVVAIAMLVAAIYAWGSVRLYAEQPGRTVIAAAVVTDLGLDRGLPTAAALAANEDVLFERTRLAAQRGAQLVVWNEVATLVDPADEARLVARGADAARQLGVELVLAYGVLVSRSPMLLDNKYVWLDAGGRALETYRKHHPVPSEPSLEGTAPLIAHAHAWGRAAGAICYDYDFPAMARAHAALGVGLVAVPSSDWRGIHPYHTRMARIRAIEGGFALVRSTRWGESAVFDAYGRPRASMSAFEATDHVLVGTVPVTPVSTIYAAAGDAPLGLASGLALVGLLVVAWRARKRREVPETSRAG